MKYGIADVWTQGDAISHGILLVLVVMSVLSWAVMLYKGAQLYRLRKQGVIVQTGFWQAGSLEAGSATLDQGLPYQSLVASACEARDRHSDSDLKEVLSPDEWIQRCLSVSFEEQVARMTSGLGVLASVGSTAPFVGLFGTVWGIYHALIGLSDAGPAGIAQVAGPVGEALVMTAFGLFVAIPAVLGYNAISRGNRAVVHKLHRFRHELHAYIMGAERHRSGNDSNESVVARKAG